MALPAWQATIVTEDGDIIPSPVITVLVESTGLPAVLFSNRAGTTPLGTAGVFTAGTDGFAQFFAAPDLYRVKASDAGSGFERTWDFVVLSGTMATVDAQTSPSDATAGRGVTTGALGDNGGPIITTTNLNIEAWTPVVADASSGGNTGSMTVNEPVYQRIGNLITIRAQLTNIDTTGLTAGNSLYIRGLPVSSSVSGQAQGSCTLGSITFSDMIVPQIGVSSGVIIFRQSTSGGANSSLLVSSISSGVADILFTLTYFVD